MLVKKAYPILGFLNNLFERKSETSNFIKSLEYPFGTLQTTGG